MKKDPFPTGTQIKIDPAEDLYMDADRRPMIGERGVVSSKTKGGLYLISFEGGSMTFKRKNLIRADL